MLALPLLVLCQVLVILASPIKDEWDGSKAVGKRDITASRLYHLRYYLQMASAAYCSSNNYSPGTQVTCIQNSCPLIETANVVTFKEFANLGPGDLTGFVAADHDQRRITVAFRGSTSFTNWAADFTAAAVPMWEICGSPCFVHAGFYYSWFFTRSVVWAAINALKKQYPTYELAFTGHSLGAAMATVYAADATARGWRANLYSYGSPHVGDLFFADFITKKVNGYRVTHTNDIVTRVLGYTVALYWHWGPQYHITSGDKKTVKPTDVDVYEGSQLWSGSTKIGLGNSVSSHSWYFEEVGRCYSQGGPLFEWWL